MDHLFDEFSKSLAESVPRRESLRRLGAVFAGAVLSPLAAGTAWAAGKQAPAQDPCKAFCDRCSKGAPRNQCLTACRACNNTPSRLCGGCGTHACCGAGTTCCSGRCADLDSDVNHCGACGNVCDEVVGPHLHSTCINGSCEYDCDEGAVLCNGVCTLDSENCGACGNVCPESAPYCLSGRCTCAPWQTECGNACVDLDFDRANCGACGVQCAASETCVEGLCEECEAGTGMRVCGNSCVILQSDPFNCGACGNVCGPDTPECMNGVCGDYCPPGLTLCFGLYCADLYWSWD